MKKLLFLIMILAILAMPVEAKTILYVTNATSDSACSTLSTPNRLYCNRLTNLGYDVKVINEDNVVQDSPTWYEYVEGSDMIFLGTVDRSMVNESRDQNIFCGNISSKMTNKKLFFTFENVQMNKTSNITGCAFHPSIKLVNYSYTENRCSQRSFKIIKEDYVTERHYLNDVIDLYTSIKSARIYDISDGGWIAAECTPPGGPIDFYPNVIINEKGAFWGFEDPNSFTNDTWEIFDRVVLKTLNEQWVVSPIIIPSIATINKTVWVFANITQLGKPVIGTAIMSADGLSKNLRWFDNLWRNYTVEFPENKEYSLNISAYSEGRTFSTLRGSTVVPLTVGSLDVEIESGDFEPNSNYTISMKLFSNGEPRDASAAFYRIFNFTSYEVLFTGSMDCVGNGCTKIIDVMPEAQNLILEVTATTLDGDGGGNFKAISKESLATDKIMYRPSETIRINFFYFEPLKGVNLTVIRPDGTKETPSPIPMINVTSTQWSRNYTLGISSLNGTYIINVTAIKSTTPITTISFNKSIDVISWYAFAYLNKRSFNSFETLNLTLEIVEVYPPDLNFSVLINIKDPENRAVFDLTKSLENKTFSINYSIPADYKNGTSSITINLSDSVGRNFITRLNFSVNATLTGPSLFITPNVISEVTIGKILERPFTLENAADLDTTTLSFNVSGEIKDKISIVSLPTSISPKGKANITVKIDASKLTEGSYSGIIDITSRVGSAQVSVLLEIVGDIASRAQEKLSEALLLEESILGIEDKSLNLTSILTLYEEIKSLLQEATTDFQNGDYASAKTKYEEASTELSDLQTLLQNLQTSTSSSADYSYIIWYFAIAVVVVIIIITFLKYRKRFKRKKEVKKEKEQNVQEVYIKPEEEYRTEYY